MILTIDQQYNYDSLSLVFMSIYSKYMQTVSVSPSQAVPYERKFCNQLNPSRPHKIISIHAAIAEIPLHKFNNS